MRMNHCVVTKSKVPPKTRRLPSRRSYFSSLVLISSRISEITKKKRELRATLWHILPHSHQVKLLMFDAQLLLCILFILAAQSTTESVRAMDMSVFEGQQFHCVDTSCAPFATATVSDLFNCQVACLARFQCKAARFDRSTLRCDLFGNLFSFNGSMLSNYNVTTSMVPTGRRTPPGR